MNSIMNDPYLIFQNILIFYLFYNNTRFFKWNKRYTFDACLCNTNNVRDFQWKFTAALFTNFPCPLQKSFENKMHIHTIVEYRYTVIPEYTKIE